MDSVNAGQNDQIKYKAIRRRKWGKWVSEIKVPGTRQRLWLGSFSTAEGAAVAHDVAFYCLRRLFSIDEESFNFPHLLSTFLPTNASPKSIQKAASDVGMAVDAGLALNKDGVVSRSGGCGNRSSMETMEDDNELSIYVYDYLEDDLV